MFPRPLKDLSVFRGDEPIEEVNIQHGIDTGITFGAGMIPGMCPDYDVYAARVRVGIIEDARWEAMNWRERARIVAFYRLEKTINLHVEEARADAELRARQQG